MKSLLDSRSKFWASPSQLLSLQMLEMAKKNALFVLNLVLLKYWWMYWFDMRSQHCWSWLWLNTCGNRVGQAKTFSEWNIEWERWTWWLKCAGVQSPYHRLAACKSQEVQGAQLKTRCLWSLQYIEQYGQVSAKVHGTSMCSLCFGVFQCCSCLLVGQFRASEGRWRVKVGTWSSKSPPFSSISSSLPVNKQVGRASGL